MKTFKEHFDPDEWDGSAEHVSPTRAVAHEILGHHFPDHKYSYYNGRLDQYAHRGRFPHQVYADLEGAGWKRIDSHTITNPGDPDTGEIAGSTTSHQYAHPDEPSHHIGIQTGHWEDETEDHGTHVAFWTSPNFMNSWRRNG